MTDSSLHSERDLPTGTVTFLFTDIESSTALLQQLGEGYADLLADQRRLLRAAFGDNNGHEVDTQGDAFFYSFSRAKDALTAAVNAQRAISGHSWPDGVAVRVRMGLHTGEPVRTDEGYVGMDVHRSARICSAGHGGQILLSQATRGLVENDLPEGASLSDLGEHRLKDLQYPEHVYQLSHPDLPTNFPSLKSLDTLPNNLPRQLTSFIGREREMEEVKTLFAHTYLLTLTGSGGCGKTRLGLQVAADLVGEYKDGAWIVELAALADPDLVTQEVASALGVREGQGDSILDTLLNYLKPRQLLLMLDNCEHLIEACTALTDSLLRSCPNLKIMVASREALGIEGESTYRVPSLSLPDPKNLPPVEKLNTYEAVKLFIDRAVAAVSTFTVTNQNASAVAQICHRLDGIPLAIELAAARIKVLEVEEITARLDDRFRLLTGGSRTALPRQQTLRATIDWSYNLLSEQESVLLGRLSVFMGGWTFEAAEEICVGEGVEDYEVLDLLTSLVEKSLVVAEGQGGKKRYHLLETVRQYARDRLLDSGESATLRDRHLEWYLEFTERAEPELSGPDQVEWLDWLESELDNLRAALEWSLGGEEVEIGLRLAGALNWFWFRRGYYNEGQRWLEESLSGSSRLPASERTKSARANALWGAGLMLFGKSDYGLAAAPFEESLALYQELGDKQGAGYSLICLGVVSGRQGDYVRGRALYEEGLSMFREVGDKLGISFSLWLLGGNARFQGDYERATPLLEESLALSREMGNKWIISTSLLELGRVAFNQGDYERAKALVEENLVLCRELGGKRGIAQLLHLLGLVALGQDDHDRATELFKESLALNQELGVKDFIAYCLEGLAGVAVAQGESEPGAIILGAAEGIRKAISAPPPPSERVEIDRNVAAVRAGLDEKTFTEAWAQGRKMSMEEAVEYAMGPSTNT